MKFKTTKMKYLVSCIITFNLLFLANFVSSADVKCKQIIFHTFYIYHSSLMISVKKVK